MKLLISAYACRPNMGSEPAVGWNWVTELNKYHDLVVLTNYTNKNYIEKYEQEHQDELKNTRFLYIRPNEKLTFWYKEWERMERIYYYLWQRKAYKVAKKLVKNESFDWVQHLTYVTCIIPTFMHKLEIPFIYGPISGGEKIPKVIEYPMSKKDKIIEKIRNATMIIPKISTNTQKAFKKSKKIIVVTEDTKSLVPKKYWDKVEIFQAIGINDCFLEPTPKFIKNDVCKVLIAGRMLPWKGFEAGIAATVKALDRGAAIELTVLGNGDDFYLQKIKKYAEGYVDKQIKFINFVKYTEMKEFYENFDVLLNCSLRDSGCLVLMEGMSRGLPVICVNTGGPKVNTSEDCAIKIKPKKFKDMVEELGNALYTLATNPDIRISMAKRSYEHASTNFRNTKKIEKILTIYTEK